MVVVALAVVAVDVDDVVGDAVVVVAGVVVVVGSVSSRSGCIVAHLVVLKPRTQKHQHTRCTNTRTWPREMFATPLPKPTTATGVDREVVVSSPSCTKKKTSRHLQPDIHLPRNKQTAPSTTITSIT